MSYDASAWAMKQRTRTHLGKLVLLILADCHNSETDLCYPSLTFLCERANCSRQGAVNVLAELESEGLISTQKTLGKKTYYTLKLVNTVDPSTELTRQTGVPVLVKPVNPTGQLASKTGQASRLEQVSNKELTGNINKEYIPLRPKVSRPDSVSEQVWADFETLRKTLKAPITETALNGIDREAGKAGISLNTALRTCVERSWRGFKSEWLQNGQSTPNGSGKYTTRTIQNAHNLNGWADA
jgi:predicted transcriptional regulator